MKTYSKHQRLAEMFTSPGDVWRVRDINSIHCFRVARILLAQLGTEMTLSPGDAWTVEGQVLEYLMMT